MITGPELKDIRLGFDIDTERFAELLGLPSDRNLRRWEAEEQDIPMWVSRVMVLLTNMPAGLRLLQERVTPEALAQEREALDARQRAAGADDDGDLRARARRLAGEALGGDD